MSAAGSTGTETGGHGRGGYIHNLYKTAEGALLIAASTAAQRKKLWEVMDMADIENDPRFATDTLCRKNVKALEGELENRLLLRTAMEWETFLQSEGVTAMAIHTIQDIANSPQIAARRFLHTFPKDPQFDLSFTVPTTSYKLSETPARLTMPPPRLGQHTDETLATLGFSVAEVAKMRSAGII